MGAIGGGVWHSVKGARLAPAGARFQGSVSAVTARAPVLGGQFAVWGGIFACCDCTLTSIRQKEDPWNSIVSGAVTGGILAARAGPKQMASAAVVGGVLLALIEGMGILFTKMMAPPVPSSPEDFMQDVTAPPTQGGLFPSFGGGSSPLSPPPPISPPPSVNEPYLETDGTTTFSTEATARDDGQSSQNSGSWWPFRSSEGK
jgi:mitochondrial import inner membrane translocase subunit TIM17